VDALGKMCVVIHAGLVDVPLYELDLSGLSTGVYQLVIHRGNAVETVRMVKQ
jgi:hypothetical protein